MMLSCIFICLTGNWNAYTVCVCRSLTHMHDPSYDSYVDFRNVFEEVSKLSIQVRGRVESISFLIVETCILNALFYFIYIPWNEEKTLFKPLLLRWILHRMDAIFKWKILLSHNFVSVAALWDAKNGFSPFPLCGWCINV